MPHVRVPVLSAIAVAVCATALSAQEPADPPPRARAAKPLPLAEIAAKLKTSEWWTGMYLRRRSVGVIHQRLERTDTGFRLVSTGTGELLGGAGDNTETLELDGALGLQRWHRRETRDGVVETRELVRLDTERGRWTRIRGADGERTVRDVALPAACVLAALIPVVLPHVRWEPDSVWRFVIAVERPEADVPVIALTVDAQHGGQVPVRTPHGDVETVGIVLSSPLAPDMRLPEIHVRDGRAVQILPDLWLPGLVQVAAPSAAAARRELSAPWSRETEAAVETAARDFLQAWLLGRRDDVARTVDLPLLRLQFARLEPAVAAMDDAAFRSDFLGRVRKRTTGDAAAVRRALAARMRAAAFEIERAEHGDYATILMPQRGGRAAPAEMFLKRAGERWLVFWYSPLATQ